MLQLGAALSDCVSLDRQLWVFVLAQGSQENPTRTFFWPLANSDFEQATMDSITSHWGYIRRSEDSRGSPTFPRTTLTILWYGVELS